MPNTAGAPGPAPAPGSARLLAALVVDVPVPGIGFRRGPSSIDRRPVTGPVEVTETGLTGDRIFDHRHHGGPDKAVYAYAESDAADWSQELGRPISAGMFGENLRTVGLDVSGALIGEVWQVGDGPEAVLFEVSMPRTPCGTFATWMDEEQWVKRFTARGAPGAYLRVRRPGRIEAGDPIQVVERPEHGVTVGGWFSRRSLRDARELTAAEQAGQLRIAPALREYVDRRLARASR